MDALYFYKSSRHDGEELRYSLRSVQRHAPWLRRIFIVGDRPDFLADSDRVIHVSYDSLCPTLGFKAPVTNGFLMLFVGSLIPELDFEFLHFCDDYVLLRDLAPEVARRQRAIEDLAACKGRGTGLWKESLWRTHDLLKRFGYTSLNFETHTPAHFTRRRVWNAYLTFKDFVTEDRFHGPLAATAVGNHALRQEKYPVVRLAAEGARVGYWGKRPEPEQLRKDCENPKSLFLNFDDDAYGSVIREYLEERFPEPGPWERTDVPKMTNFGESEASLWFTAQT